MGVNTHPGNDLRAQVILHISRVADKCIDRLSHFQRNEASDGTLIMSPTHV
jgi:hypothetical protein